MKSKKGVDEALGLPSLEEWQEMTGEVSQELSSEMELYQDEEEMDTDEISLEEAKEAMAKLKAMRTQLKDIPDITSRKAHLDRLADLAEKRFEDIFDRAFNCEDRFASEMINAANAMLKIALDAHSKIIDSDVKLVDLQIKKDKIEVELNLRPKEKAPEVGEKDISNGVSMSRNELLALRKQNNK
ncbi:hypothetical protein SEPL_192 [Salmonella phage SE_PL]|uniref:hypothetical protein n=1 Tax=Salmonella enterica TaxID=28901 RepID=UPI000FDF7715|nr:hypothetical protein CPT_Munch_235 [Salmonella phage Munch]EAZ2023019.1 Sec1 family protein [Salmonella enterica]ECV9084155.1 Sec1 family protein [Salmonella enterica subsp. enterica serovar Infantis]MCP0435743.1 hypothetical protein [Salmonella enterica subsp. enterica serovar Mbandaka]QCW18922.1 hypothetical protein 7t3_0401 [Salmonella phage 7t3]QIG62805.1 hypothetical protein SEPL_192 [Salmonella phage SE_PL]WNV47341.1 hypothetical protein [Klebsiella phage fENko-Kae01]